MFKAIQSPYLIPYGDKAKLIKLSDYSSEPPPGIPAKSILEDQLRGLNEKLKEQQRLLFGHHKYSILLIFQGMDGSGKDSAIREIFSGINPAGCQVYGFGPPSKEDLAHDFLWRTTKCLPERGRLGIFNRSYYEEVLIVRVHPELLVPQNLPSVIDMKTIWDERLKSIRDHENHLASNGIMVLKFWLNISKKEQQKRLLTRLDNPAKNWKFEEADVMERKHWNEYMKAYHSALVETSKPWAPWYAIPANNKAFARVCIADIIVKNVETLHLHYRVVAEAEKSRYDKMRKMLNED